MTNIYTNDGDSRAGRGEGRNGEGEGRVVGEGEMGREEKKGMEKVKKGAGEGRKTPSIQPIDD